MKKFQFELTKKVIEHSKVMLNIYFGLNCDKTGKMIMVGDIVKFESNDIYSWHEFLVCFSQNSNKFYLLPHNFEHAPISLIRRYSACDQKLYYNTIVLVKHTNYFWR
ncbi:MAG: hypothetical protein KQ78_01822 [Candidatus Izimaplasma bacterium HR2]|nr:MAG: hypothetical protein KQ78_01822 [Candidatus Izimaplasma bacterium HR2]